MDVLLSDLLRQLHQQSSADGVLKAATAVYHQHLQTAVTLACPLISETGGIPILPPICVGEVRQTNGLDCFEMETAVAGTLGDLIRYDQTYFENNAKEWARAREQTDWPCFIQQEQIESFIFLPIGYRGHKLALFLFAFCESQVWSEDWRNVLTASGLLVSNCLMMLSDNGRHQQKRMATAHTVYGNVANMLKGQLDTLEAEVQLALGQPLPKPLAAHLQETKAMAFQEMRELVLEASGDLLVDLRTMSLVKALLTTTAALERAWPQGQGIEIEIAPIPKMIEQQSPVLREIVYTLVLEGIGNSIKHGGPAPYIHVGMRWQNNHLFVQVIDHGEGFDKEERPFSRYGLGYWQQYITQQLGGFFQVSSQPQYGTVINAQIPVISVRNS